MVTRRTDAETLAGYATDESGIFTADDLQAVYTPQSEAELAETLVEANREQVLATVSGAGTGITGGRVALHGGIVISTEQMCTPLSHSSPALETEHLGRHYTIHVDEAAGEARVPAGMPLDVLEQLLPAGLLYPPDPTERTASLGGTLATNASGARTFHYGATREWVLGLRVVLPTGETLAINRGEVCATGRELHFTTEQGTPLSVPVPTYTMPRTKNAAGLYAAPDMDLIDLFIGSEGILGVVSEARLRLAPRPPELVSEIAFFTQEIEALAFVNDLRAAAISGTMDVLSLEYFDADSLGFMEHPLVQESYGAAVYTEVAGTVDEVEPLLSALEEHHCVEDWFAETADDRREQREFRHSLPDGVNSYLRRHGSQKLGTDLVVPPEDFPALLASYRAAGAAFAREYPREGKHTVIFGHVGNYHLHVNFITHGPEELTFAKHLYSGLARQAIAAGGTISGEHGVGKKTIALDGRTIPYLEIMYGHTGLLQIARAKRAVDPRLILNIGNIVPREYFREL